MACLIEMMLGIHRQKFPVHRIQHFEITSYRDRHPVRGFDGGIITHMSGRTRCEAKVLLEKLEPVEMRYLLSIKQGGDEITIGPLPLQTGDSVRVIGSVRSITPDLSNHSATLIMDIMHTIADRGAVGWHA